VETCVATSCGFPPRWCYCKSPIAILHVRFSNTIPTVSPHACTVVYPPTSGDFHTMTSVPQLTPPSQEKRALTFVRATAECDPPCTSPDVAVHEATVFLHPGSGRAPTSSGSDHVSPPSLDTIVPAQCSTIGLVHFVEEVRRATNSSLPVVPTSAREPSPVPGKKDCESRQETPSSSERSTCEAEVNVTGAGGIWHVSTISAISASYVQYSMQPLDTLYVVRSGVKQLGE